MTFNKHIYYLLIFFFLLGCSKDDSIDLSNAENVFQPKLNVSFVNEKDRNNSQLSGIIDIKEILNSKSHNLINARIKFPFKKKWQLDTDQDVDDENPYLPEPLFFESNIYLLNNKGYLFKINAEKGKIVWKKNIFKDLEDTIIGTPAISGTKNNDNTITLFAHNGSGELIAINGDNGKVIWKKKEDIPFRGGITSYKNLIFVNNFDGNFLSIEKENGLTLWNVFLGSDYNSVYTTARPIIAKNKIVVPTTGGTFFIISIDTGEVLWSENISSNQQLPKLFHVGDIVANPLYYQGVIYVVSQSGVTAAFDIDTSEMLWNIPIGGFETPTISGKTIFIMGNMGLLAAIDTNSGKIRWQKKYPSYLNTDSFFLDEEIAIYKGPTLFNSKILISDQKGKISVIDANNGTEIDTIKVDELAFPPIPVDKKILFLTENGKLLAYK